MPLRLVETNKALHIQDTFSFYKMRSTDRHFCHRLRLDVFIKPLMTEIFFLSKFLCKTTPKRAQEEITYLQNEQITSHPPYYASYENRKKKISPITLT